jgi:cell division septum initiation protein DivIVA
MAENEPAEGRAPPLIPPEVRAGLRRRVFGYEVDAVERMIEAMTACYEQMWRENSELRAQATRLDREVARRTSEEREIREALLAAHSAAEVLRTQAIADAERKTRAAAERVQAALAEAGSRQRAVEAEVKHLKSVGAEIQAGYRAFLLAALEVLETESRRLEAASSAGAELERGDEETRTGEPARPSADSDGGA